ncbi:MAG TPA: Calx-beta domain-containing protein [Verrucomicrobiae bacterium]
MKRYFVPLFVGGGVVFTVWLAVWPSPGGREHAISPATGVFQVAKPQTPLTPTPQSSVAVNGQTGVSVAGVVAITQAEPYTANMLPAFRAFSDWAERFLGAGGAVSEVRGRVLAWKRREAMLDLIQDNPQQALALAVPFRWRQALPASVTQYFEEQIDGRGSLDVAVASGTGSQSVTHRRVLIGQRSFQTFVYGRRLAQGSQENAPLHGIALEGKLALHCDPTRVLEPVEAAARENSTPTRHLKSCAVCAQPASGAPALAADIGGELAYYCGVEHQEVVNQLWLELETRSKGDRSFAKNLAQWTLGPKMLLYMRVNFPDDLSEPVSEAAAYDAMDEVNDFYVENSYGLTSVTPLVTPLLTLPRTKAGYGEAGPFAVLDDARTAARLAGYDTAFFDLDIVAHTSVPGFDWAGLGFVGGKGTWLQSMGVGVTAHELGHNYGVMHANFWDTSTNYNSGIAQGWSVEYGNIYDTMGAASAGRNHFNAYFKNQLKWLPSTAIAAAASNGVYRLYSYDLPHRLNGPAYAVRVTKDFQRDYWLEFRQLFASDVGKANGVLLNWSPWESSKGGTDLIDTTPGSPGADSREDAALVIGRTFSDFAAGVHITPLARGVDGTNSWIDVQVNRGAFPENQPPTLQIEVDIPNPQPGELVHFHAKAADPDGDRLAYAWWFDHTAFSTNNLPWVSRSWAAKSTHVVRCVVSDMKGAIASANVVVPVGGPSGHMITGRIIDTNGLPVEGVRVDNLADTNAAQSLLSFTDTEGRYVIAGFTVDANLSAGKYGFTFTNISWTNPITAGANVVDVDFIATALPVVTIAATPEEVVENSAAPASFVLRRTGDIATNLIVNVWVTGSATLGRDYRLDPPLTNGLNTLEFPPDVGTLQVTLKPINDTIAEAPESATLALVEGDAYVIGSLGQASIRILDDDSQGAPVISVAASNPFCLENGTDSGEVVFQRSGSTAGDLYVYYSVAGTATPGVDYATPAGVVLIPEGQSSAAVRFLPIDDKEVEPDETIVVTVLPHPAYLTGSSAAQVTIIDDDMVTLTVYPTGAAAREPSMPGRFTVKRDGDLTSNLKVFYSVGGTATSGEDYVPLSGELLIPAGSASADIVVTPLDDILVEGDESVTVTLTNSAAYDVGTPGTATLLIFDNEKPAVSITARDDKASEPGEDFGTFVISRGNVTQGALPVYLAISGTAINGIDYIPLDNMVVIPNGARQVSVDVIPFDDLHSEPVETVELVLLPNTNYTLGSPVEAVVNIEDNDFGSPAVGFTFNSSSAPESESPGIQLSLSSPSAGPVTVNYRVIGGTATSNDYVLPPGPLTIDPLITNAVLPLRIRDNTIPQPDRTLRIALYDPVSATLDGIKIHTYTILDDDSAAVSVSATEPDAFEGGSPGNFRITRVGSTDSNLLVFFQVAGTASAPADYAPLGTSVLLPAGADFVDLAVTPVDDQTVESAETVTLELIRAPGARIVSPITATVTIHSKEAASLPVVSISSTNRPDAVEGGPAGEFAFYRSNTVGSLTVFFTVTGTAIPGGDYVALPEFITFADGQGAVTLPVTALDDNLIEGEETVILSLTQQDTYRVSYPGSATVLVQDNDQRVQVDASDFIAAEPGRDPGEFTFTRLGTTNGDLRVDFTISGTAINGVDFVAISNWVTIPAGHYSATLPIQVLDDLLVEGPETITVTLEPGTAYALASPTSATITIEDDEPMLTITATVPTVVEGSQRPGVLTLTRTGDLAYEFIAYLAVDGTATFGVDYPPFATNVFFACGVAEIDLAIYPVNELVVEGTETVIATLLPNPAYTILSPSNALVAIEDAGLNRSPEISIERPSSLPVHLRGPTVTLVVRATVTDDGGPAGPTNSWTMVSGPCPVVFGANNAPTTTVSFTNAGFYLIRLTADDGQLQSFRDIPVTVTGEALFQDAVLHWTLDDGAGTNAADASGFGRDGVLVGSPQWVSNGIFGGALEFFGPGDFVRGTGTSNLFSLRDELSVSLWFNPADTNLDQAIFCANTGSTNGTLALMARRLASCGQGSNVYEATLATTAGVVRYVSSSQAVKPGWHNLLITWASGSSLAFYIDGELDRRGTRPAELGGFIANSPEFIIGRGPIEAPFSLRGQVDDVLVFPRALNETEAAGIGGGTCTTGTCRPVNFGPVVEAGTNITVQLPIPVQLTGTVTDDGLPDPPAAVSNFWELVSSPAPVVVPDPNALTNTIQFSQTGTNIFRLTADDGAIATCDEVTVFVIEPTQVDIWASDPEGAELGPDPAEFTLSRQGAADYILTVFFEFSGIATNGVDFVRLTNAVTFPAGTNALVIPIVPYLDHRTEGDQDLTITILTNLAYTVGNGQATIIIHDSPYGMWTINHFTLEELTDPTLSGETADFDHDGLINFVEYASNLDPKVPDTNAPVVVTVETNASTGELHAVLTFHRRLPPTDVGYAPGFSEDLVTWHTGTNYVEELQTVDDGNWVTETVMARMRAPLSNQTNQFVTVRVWLEATQPPPNSPAKN